MNSNYIRTFTGKKFHPWAVHLNDGFDIVDIAHALSNQCRFGGHTKEFYSVAQHCWYVSRILPPELQLEGLMHDAAEAYLIDLPRPIKRHSNLTYYNQLEGRVEYQIAKQFRLTYPWPDKVMEADRLTLAYEMDKLLHGVEEGVEGEVMVANTYPEPSWYFQAWTPKYAKQQFLDVFYALTEIRSLSIITE